MNKRMREDDPRKDNKYGSKYGRGRPEEEERDEDEEPVEAACGGYMGGMGQGLMGPDMMMPPMYTGVDPESGNPVPVGADEENVRDDIPAMLSEGEYVLPADVVKWYGLKGVLELQEEARHGLMAMSMEGLIQQIDPDMDESDSTLSTTEKYDQLVDHTEDAGMEVSEEDGEITVTDSDDEEYETPEGNEVEETEFVVEEETMEQEEPTEEEMEDIYPTRPGQMAFKNTPKIVFMR